LFSHFWHHFVFDVKNCSHGYLLWCTNKRLGLECCISRGVAAIIAFVGFGSCSWRTRIFDILMVSFWIFPLNVTSKVSDMLACSHFSLLLM
jgi:hypothetical protein